MLLQTIRLHEVSEGNQEKAKQFKYKLKDIESDLIKFLLEKVVVMREIPLMQANAEQN